MSSRLPVPAHLLALAAITAAGAAFRFVGIGDQSFWYDEYTTTLHVSLDFGGMLHHVANATERHLPFHFVLAWFWERLFGDSEAGLRSLSAVAGTLTIPVAYAVVRELATRRAGLVAAAIVAVNPFLVWYSQEARAYAVLVLVCSLSFLFFVRALEQPGVKNLAGWTAFSAMAVATHNFAWLFVAVEAAWLLVTLAPRRRAVLAASVPIAAAAAAMVPLLFSQRGGIDWVAGISLGYRLRRIPQEWTTGYSEAAAWIVLAAIGIALVAALLLATRADRRELRGARIGAGVAAGGLALALIAAAVGYDYILPRYMLPFWLPLFSAVAIGLGARRAGAGGLAAAAALCAISVVLTIEVASNEVLQRPEWRRAAALLEPASGRRLVTTPAFRQSWAILHYLDGTAVLQGWQTVKVSELDVVEYRESPRGRGGLCWWGAVCILPTREEARFEVPAAFRLVDRRDDGRYSALVYRARRPQPVKGEVVGGGRSVFVQAPAR